MRVAMGPRDRPDRQSVLIRAALLFVLLLALAPACRAQGGDGADAALDAARRSVQTIERDLQLDAIHDKGLGDARRRLLGLQQQADAVIAQQTPALQAAQARLAELGAAPAQGEEASDVAARRRELQQSSGQIEARIKLARLLGVESAQLADRIASRQRERFREQLFERAESPLSADFWNELRTSLVRDAARVSPALHIQQVPASQWLGAALAVALGIAVRFALGQALKRFVTDHAPHGRLRRSVLALARALLAIVVPGASVWALQIAVGPTLAPPWQMLLGDALGAVCFAAYVSGLGGALLSAAEPSWRLPPIPDPAARRLRDDPALIGAAVFAAWLLLRLTIVFDTELATTVASDALVALVLGLALARPLWRVRRVLPAGERPARWWMQATVRAIWVVLIASVVAVLIGFVALGSFIVRQTAWTAILLATAWLLAAVIDDAAMAWRGVGERAVSARRAPVAVLASGALRVGVLVALVLLLLAPFGENPTELLLRAGNSMRSGLKVGELELRPLALLQALAVLALALIALALLKRWLAERFLPTTGLDEGMRTSLVTLFAFVSSVVAVALALSALGLALEKVAWIASALSVGIGFGLQAVVSNFVSGLILLAERPVRVGDRVSLGGVEGDIRRINVRATEIELDDRSTLIVPNSEFITKVVRNLTHDHAPALVQVRLPLPLSTDVEQVRTRLLAAFAANDDVLADPPPAVQLEGVDADKLVFVGSCFVTSPRKAQAVKTASLARVLAELHQADAH